MPNLKSLETRNLGRNIRSLLRYCGRFLKKISELTFIDVKELVRMFRSLLRLCNRSL